MPNIGHPNMRRKCILSCMARLLGKKGRSHIFRNTTYQRFVVFHFEFNLWGNPQVAEHGFQDLTSNAVRKRYQWHFIQLLRLDNPFLGKGVMLSNYDN